MSDTRGKLFYGWLIVIVCTLVMATMFALMLSCLSLFVVPVTEDLGISRSEFAAVSTVVSVMGIFLSPVAGGILGKRNIRPIMAGGLLVCTLAYASFSFAQSSIHLYISAVFMGLCFQFSTTVPISILITRWFVKSRGTAMSITFAGSSIGGVILSPVITAMLGSMGWRMSFQILGLGMCVVLVPLVLLLVRSTPEEKGLSPLGAQETAGTEGGAPPAQTGIPLAQLRKTPTFYVFIVGLFICILTMGSIYHVPAHIQGIGFSPEQAALCVSVYSFVGIFGKLILGAVFDRAGLKGGILFGILTMVATFALLLVAGSIAMLIVMSVLFGLGQAHGTIFPPTLTGRLFGTKYYGQTFGLVNSFASLSMAVANPMMAATFDIGGSYRVAWIIGICCGVAAIFLLLAAERGSKKLLQQVTGAEA